MLNKLIIYFGIAIMWTGLSFVQKNNFFCFSEIGVKKDSVTSAEHRHWTIQNLSDSLANLNTNELRFMNENSMQGTYIEIGAGTSFERLTENDDLYYLYAGYCNVRLDNRTKSFESGDIIYVKKGSQLILKNDDELLQIVIISMYLSSNSAKPKWKSFSKKSIESPRKPEENIWNPFILYSNVMLGLYMLPSSLDGDQRLVHEWQELNIVTAGKSKFIMDSGTIDVEEGSIFFVEEGNGHYFDELESDMDILILWEMRNVDHSGH